jgi:thiol-disulfide isomerase/thioredoxin
MNALRLPVEGRLRSFDGATGWLNSPPLTPGGLRGKVVLADFWTYTCINWLRQLPYVRAWHAKYAGEGLVVIGVHTPEFPFEHDADNVRRAVKDMAIDYPVAIDSDYAVWRAFDNHYWPALYVADREGKIRRHHFGEGDYDRLEVVLQQLLGSGDHEQVSPDAHGFEVPADWDSLYTPENYTGYRRTENFASPGGLVPDRPHGYAAPDALRLNHWALSGEWTALEGAVAASTAGVRITYRFQARDLHVVMGPATAGTRVRFRVLLDGRPPGPAHGLDVDADGNGAVTEQRLHQLLRQPGPIDERTFEITFLDAGLEAYAFTFG